MRVHIWKIHPIKNYTTERISDHILRICMPEQLFPKLNLNDLRSLLAT
jgi:hypothetical protein